MSSYPEFGHHLRTPALNKRLALTPIIVAFLVWKGPASHIPCPLPILSLSKHNLCMPCGNLETYLTGSGSMEWGSSVPCEAGCYKPWCAYQSWATIRARVFMQKQTRYCMSSIMTAIPSFTRLQGLEKVTLRSRKGSPNHPRGGGGGGGHLLTAQTCEHCPDVWSVVLWHARCSYLARSSRSHGAAGLRRRRSLLSKH